MRGRLLLPFLIAGLLPLAARLQAPAPAVQTAYTDGPYVLWTGSKAEVLRVQEGRLMRESLPAAGLVPWPGHAPLQLDPAGPGAAQTRFPDVPRIAAVSDIHGNLTGFLALLKAQGILDAQARWALGQGHLVVVGDAVDRGPHVTELLWLLRSLESQALKAGGRLHMVMGNHEAMILKGDLRYLNPKYTALAGNLLPGFQTLYGTDSELGRWIRRRPAMVQIGRTLFMHGGLSPQWFQAHPGLDAVNASLEEAWRTPGPKPPVLATQGPLWYRGFIPGADARLGDATPAHIVQVLQAFGADRFVVGHTTLKAITAFHGGRVIGVDAGLLDNCPGEVLWIEQGKTFRGLADGKRVPLP